MKGGQEEQCMHEKAPRRDRSKERGSRVDGATVKEDESYGEVLNQLCFLEIEGLQLQK